MKTMYYCGVLAILLLAACSKGGNSSASSADIYKQEFEKILTYFDQGLQPLKVDFKLEEIKNYDNLVVDGDGGVIKYFNKTDNGVSVKRTYTNHYHQLEKLGIFGVEIHDEKSFNNDKFKNAVDKDKYLQYMNGKFGTEYKEGEGLMESGSYVWTREDAKFVIEIDDFYINITIHPIED